MKTVINDITTEENFTLTNVRSKNYETFSDHFSSISTSKVPVVKQLAN